MAINSQGTWFVLVLDGRGLDTIGPKMSKSSFIGAALPDPAPLLAVLTAGASEKEKLKRNNETEREKNKQVPEK